MDFEENENIDFTKLPIYKKGKDIFHLVENITALIPDDDALLCDTKRFMYEDAAMIPAKIAGAVGGDLYDIKMENATLIRKAARDLILHCRSLEMEGFSHPEYLDLIRKEIEDLRLLFVDWVSGFDQSDHLEDDWGLFNPS